MGKGKGSSHQETEREGGLGKRIESECRESLGVGERDNQQEWGEKKEDFKKMGCKLNPF